MNIHDVANTGNGDLKAVYCGVRDVIGFLLHRTASQIRSLSECRLVALIRLALMMQVALEEGPKPDEDQQQQSQAATAAAAAAAGMLVSESAAAAAPLEVPPAFYVPMPSTVIAATADAVSTKRNGVASAGRCGAAVAKSLSAEAETPAATAAI